MKNIVSDNEKIEKLIQYYKDNGLLIVGLNDSQGVNTTSTFFDILFLLSCYSSVYVVF